MNSWAKSDSYHYSGYQGAEDKYVIGPDDHRVMMLLAKEGSVDAKYRRMINVTLDITAPLYWWKEFDAYKIGTVANSCSTMHKIHAKEFTPEDFSCEHLFRDPAEIVAQNIDIPDFPNREEEIEWNYERGAYSSYEDGNEFEDWVASDYAMDLLNTTISAMNYYRSKFLETKDKRYWWQLIQLLPSSYNQRRTVQVNYEVLAGIYPKRKDHKLDEWHIFCDWIKTLPYSEIITLEENE
jgi:hypothetical protein